MVIGRISARLAGVPVSNRQGTPFLQNSLSAKFIVLSLFFGAAAVGLMSAPVIWRLNTFWLGERLHAAHLASLALEATADGMVDLDLQKRLLDHAGVLGVTVSHDDGRVLMLGPNMPLNVDKTFDKQGAGPFESLLFAAETLMSRGDRALRIVGESRVEGGAKVEIYVRESVLRTEVAADVRRIFTIGVFTTILMSIMLYVVLQSTVVRRLRGLTSNILWFRKAPEDSRRIIHPSGSLDEIGIAEQALQQMQADVRNALTMQAHLAAIGTAVSKVQHDLRGVLSSAMVLSDHLEDSADPEVRRIAPTMIASLERAVQMCMTTMNYARQGMINILPSRFSLSDVVMDVIEANRVVYGGNLINAVDPSIEVVADREQIYRAVANLLRNALEAKASQVTVSAAATDGGTEIIIADDGGGIPRAALQNLFVPFLTAGQAGKTGLGLSIAREIMSAHGGSIDLLRSGPEGTTFRLWLPAAAG